MIESVKMKKYKKYILGLIFVIATLLRYYYLNHSFGINTCYPTSICSCKDTVDLSNYLCAGRAKYMNVSAELIKSQVYSFHELIETYNVDGKAFSEYEENKFIIIEIAFKNRNEKKIEMRMSDFTIIGDDWYCMPNHELSNVIMSDGDCSQNLVVGIMPDETFNAQLVYVLYKGELPEKRFNNLKKENVLLELTMYPEKKYFKLL